MEELERLCRDLYAEYESLRDAKRDLPRTVWKIAEQTRVTDPLFYERRLKEAIGGIEEAFFNEAKESAREDATQHIYRMSRYAFMIAVGKRLNYDRLMPHRNIEEGYESGFDADLSPEIVFYRTGINDQNVSELFYFLGTAYKGAKMDPVIATGDHLRYIRELKTKG